MIPHYVYDQLAMVELLGLYVMVHYVWPRRGTVSPPPPVPPVPPLLKRKRANALTPFGPLPTLTRVAHCLECLSHLDVT
jgi:hypothetical protein